MRQTQLVNQKAEGFTLIEVLMAVLLIAILATIAITQFTNFARDTRNAATKENLGILRNAIQKHYGTMRLRCNVTNGMQPTLDMLNSNNVADTSSPCAVTDVPEVSDRYFVVGGIPENPWSDKACTGVQRRTVSAAEVAAVMQTGVNAGTLTDAGGNCGWIYRDSTGEIKANSANNEGDNGLVESGY